MTIKPKRYPHSPRRAYTLRGFDARVRRHLRHDGFTAIEVEKLRLLYFSLGTEGHQDDTGCFRNRRQYRLHRLARKGLRFDRKSPLFELVKRSELFYVFCDEDGRVSGFVSPRAVIQRGAILLPPSEK